MDISRELFDRWVLDVFIGLYSYRTNAKNMDQVQWWNSCPWRSSHYANHKAFQRTLGYAADNAVSWQVFVHLYALRNKFKIYHDIFVLNIALFVLPDC